MSYHFLSKTVAAKFDLTQMQHIIHRDIGPFMIGLNTFEPNSPHKWAIWFPNAVYKIGDKKQTIYATGDTPDQMIQSLFCRLVLMSHDYPGQIIAKAIDYYGSHCHLLFHPEKEKFVETSWQKDVDKACAARNGEGYMLRLMFNRLSRWERVQKTICETFDIAMHKMALVTGAIMRLPYLIMSRATTLRP